MMKVKFMTDDIPQSCINISDLDESCPGLRLTPDYFCMFAGIHFGNVDPLVERLPSCPLVKQKDSEE